MTRKLQAEEEEKRKWDAMSERERVLEYLSCQLNGGFFIVIAFVESTGR